MKLDDQTILARLQFARKIAFSAGRLTLQYFEQGTCVERKSDNTPVTIADRQAESQMRDQIAEEYPDDGILGEEYGEHPGSSGFRWILDPIDGTKSFISDVPFYGTLVGVEFEEKSLIGVIELPALDKRIYAAVGHGAFSEKGDSQPLPARVSDCSKLKEAIFLTTDVEAFHERNSIAYNQLQNGCWFSRTWGDCYGYYLVATGKADIMVDPIMNLWDAAALQPILTEAGGHFVDWTGQETIYSDEGVATNGDLLARILAILNPKSV